MRTTPKSVPLLASCEPEATAPKSEQESDMDEIINGLLDLVVIGKIASLVLVTVQGLKVFKFVTDEISIGKAAIITALVGGIGLAAGELFVPAAPFIAMFFTLYISVMVAGLGYKYIVGPLFEKFGLDVSSQDLT